MMENTTLMNVIRKEIKMGNTAQVLHLLDEEKTLLHLMTPFGSWLHIAASHGKIDIVKQLIAMGLDKNRRGGTFKGNALNEAASKGHADIVQYLLSCDTEIDTSEPERNPLFAAIYGGHVDVVRLLIAHGMNIQIQYTGDSMKNMDALAYAIERGQTQIADILRDHLHQSGHA